MNSLRVCPHIPNHRIKYWLRLMRNPVFPIRRNCWINNKSMNLWHREASSSLSPIRIMIKKAKVWNKYQKRLIGVIRCRIGKLIKNHLFCRLPIRKEIAEIPTYPKNQAATKLTYSLPKRILPQPNIHKA